MAAAVAWISANSGLISAAASIGSGLMSMAQSGQQADSMRFQAELAGIQAQERSINYKREELNATRQANEITDRLRRANAAVVARSYAMGVMPFSGSPLDLQKFNDQKAGEDMEFAKLNKEAAGIGAKNSLLAGDLQARQFNSAADAASSGGLMRGLFQIGSGIGGFAKLGSAPTTGNAGFTYYGM